MLVWFVSHWLDALTTVLLVGLSAAAARLLWRTDSRRRDILLFVVASIVAAIMAVLAFVPPTKRWLFLCAGLPASFIAFHVLQVALAKNRALLDGDRVDDVLTDDPKMKERLLGLIRAARKREDRHYSPTSLILRFFAPCVVITLTVLTVGWVLTAGISPFKVGSTVLEPAQYAAVGAYLYVLLFLGNRMFRGDITTGAILWSSVTLLAGPILGGVISALGLKGEGAGPHLVHFASGFSLRFMATAVEAIVRRTVGGQAIASARTLPLAALRGITKDDEERLAEEGIRDVTLLAMANPHRLLQSTPYDRRQVLAWMDEALLLTFLPAEWQALEAAGITGIIDLAWHAGGEDEDLATVPSSIKGLATRTRLEPAGLWESTLRAHQDPQVQLVWALYLEETHLGDGESAVVPEYLQVQRESAPLQPVPPEASSGKSENLELVRRRLYADNRGLFLVHATRPSTKEGQQADILIRVVQHRNDPPLDIERVEYQLGPKFNNEAPIVKTQPANGFPLAISAYGPLLCVARVTLRAGDRVVLHRYLDFEMRR
jgi:hypothetical protein